MDNRTGANSNNPVKDATPRQGNSWWIIVIILLIAGGIFWALGRSDRDAVETAPVGAPTGAVHTARPDQIQNTVEADDQDPPEDIRPAEPARVEGSGSN